MRIGKIKAAPPEINSDGAAFFIDGRQPAGASGAVPMSTTIVPSARAWAGHGEGAVLAVLNPGEALAVDARHNEGGLRKGLSQAPQLSVALRHVSPEVRDPAYRRMVRPVLLIGNPLRMDRHLFSARRSEGERRLSGPTPEVEREAVGVFCGAAAKRTHLEAAAHIREAELRAAGSGEREELRERQMQARQVEEHRIGERIGHVGRRRPAKLLIPGIHGVNQLSHGAVFERLGHPAEHAARQDVPHLRKRRRAPLGGPGRLHQSVRPVGKPQGKQNALRRRSGLVAVARHAVPQHAAGLIRERRRDVGHGGLKLADVSSRH